MEKKVLIVGAGKIGRGFVGQLFYNSGYKLWFIDASKEVVSLLNEQRRYRVDIARDGGDLTEYIEVEGAYTLEDKEKIALVLSGVEIMVTSVGAVNIEKVTRSIKELLVYTQRKESLNWIICENANSPAKNIKKVLLENADTVFENFVRSKIGLIETQVLRTGMLADAAITSKEPLALRMQDWWTLPFDKDAFIGPFPDIKGLVPKSDFANELVRKLYTFNGTNGPIAYIGWANGYTILHEAALAFPQFFKQIQEESAFGLIKEFGLDEKEQRDFMALAMKKYTDPTINDLIERNANDSRRKVSKGERLMGPATLCLKYVRTPGAYAKAIAAAYYYHGSTDEGTREVQHTIKQSGIEYAIRKFSSIDESSPLYNLILESYKSKSFIF